MNYKRIYFQIIRNRRNNPLPADEYGELHHIKPKSFGRSEENLDDQKNLIRLSTDLPVNILLFIFCYTRYINTESSLSRNQNAKLIVVRKWLQRLNL